MSIEFTDAKISAVAVNVQDTKGRRASMTFDDEGIVFRSRRPQQGKIARVSYERLLNLAEDKNPEFFDLPKSRKHKNVCSTRP